MQSDHSLWAIVPAAGIGSRLGAGFPKQYLMLNEKPLLGYTLDVLLDYKPINKIVVVTQPEDGHWEEFDYAKRDAIMTAPGGDTRAHSVLNGLDVIASLASPDDWVLVHDAARPGLSGAMMDRLLAAVVGHPVGGLLGMPTVDTVKRVNMRGEVLETLPREQIWQAQTPQVFRYGLLYQALQTALDEGVIITDESSAVERAGHQPVVVEGDAQNFKVTSQADWQKMQEHLQREAL